MTTHRVLQVHLGRWSLGFIRNPHVNTGKRLRNRTHFDFAVRGVGVVRVNRRMACTERRWGFR